VVFGAERIGPAGLRRDFKLTGKALRLELEGRALQALRSFVPMLSRTVVAWLALRQFKLRDMGLLSESTVEDFLFGFNFRLQ
jgi:hypothetical protein